MPAPPSSPPDEPALELLGTLLLKTEVCATIAATAMLLLLLLLIARHFDERNAYVKKDTKNLVRAWSWNERAIRNRIARDREPFHEQQATRLRGSRWAPTW